MTIDRTQINTRERALSTDVNRLIALINRAIQEGVHGLCSTAGQRQSGVVHGFTVTAVGGGTLDINISAGLAFVKRAAVYPATQWAWTENQATKNMTLDGGDADPRVDVVEVRAGEAVSVSQGRDVFNPNLGTFALQNMTKEWKSEPEFRIVKGTPTFPIAPMPGGTAGWCPLAYINVAPNATEITAANVALCRPILSPDPTTDRRVEGGGLIWAADGLTGTHQGANGRFTRSRLNWEIPPSTVAKLGLFNIDGGTLPVANTVLYVYAIPPPYPTGYDTDLAPREVSATDATWFVNGGGYELGQKNCIVVFSSSAPSDTTSLLGSSSGNGSLGNARWGGGQNSLDRSSWVYLGAVFFDIAVPGVVIQRCRGSWIGTFRKPGVDFELDLPIVAPTQYNAWNNLVADSPIKWPNTALLVELAGRFDNDPGGHLEFRIEDYWASGTRGVINHVHMNQVGVGRRGGGEWQIGVDASGNFSITVANAALINGDMRFYGRRYQDSILARR